VLFVGPLVVIYLPYIGISWLHYLDCICTLTFGYSLFVVTVLVVTLPYIFPTFGCCIGYYVYGICCYLWIVDCYCPWLLITFGCWCPHLDCVVFSSFRCMVDPTWFTLAPLPWLLLRCLVPLHSPLPYCVIIVLWLWFVVVFIVCLVFVQPFTVIVWITLVYLLIVRCSLFVCSWLYGSGFILLPWIVFTVGYTLYIYWLLCSCIYWIVTLFLLHLPLHWIDSLTPLLLLQLYVLVPHYVVVI